MTDTGLPEPTLWVAAPPRAGLMLMDKEPSGWDSWPLYTADQIRAAIAQERDLRTAMGVAWAAQLEAYGMPQEVAMKIVVETVNRLADAIRGQAEGERG